MRYVDAVYESLAGRTREVFAFAMSGAVKEQGMQLVGQQIGPLTIEKEIGTGAMGTVYLARHAKMGRQVAIKFILSGLDHNPKTLARFERESQILKQLNHKNIVRWYGAFRHRDTPFYVMEYIDGESLESILERRGRLPWEEVVTLGKQICAALQHAHDQGIIHRDLKPANIMVTRDGTAKLTDFSIAKDMDASRLTATNHAVGTAFYMSPEQCRGERNLTAKSDLYSLGVMLYELVTGKKPFHAESTLEMFLAHTEGKFERPSRLVMDIPVWLDTLVCQLLEKDKDKRPYDAALVGEALNQVLEKVAAQRSAGVEAVSSSRTKDRSLVKTEVVDLDGARALHAAVTKKRPKRRSKPVYERPWFQAAGILGLLLFLGGAIYWFTRPPTPAHLYQKAQKLMASEDPDTWDQAREGPIRDYLRYYKGRTDEQALQMQAWADQVDLHHKERAIHNRFRRNITAEGEAETRAFAALRQEDGGEVAEARETWQALESKYQDASDPEERVWNLLAVKKLRDLNDLGERDQDLHRKIELAVQEGTAAESKSEAESLALQAIRYDVFGDPAAALERWKAMKDKYKSDQDKRSWVVLASKKIRDLGGKGPRPAEERKNRLELLQRKLKEANELVDKNPRGARAIFKDIILLYGIEKYEAEVGDLVQQARNLVNKLPGEPAK